MIAIDTNLLVYYHRGDSQWHELADRLLTELITSGVPWAIPWPCIHEFLAIVTHPRIFNPPTPLATALAEVNHWLASPSLALLHEDLGFWERFSALLDKGKIVGPRVHDARIAALCLDHGVSELWSADRDFSAFAGLPSRNHIIV